MDRASPRAASRLLSRPTLCGASIPLNKPVFTLLCLPFEFFPAQSRGPSLGARPRDLVQEHSLEPHSFLQHYHVALPLTGLRPKDQVCPITPLGEGGEFAPPGGAGRSAPRLPSQLPAERVQPASPDLGGSGRGSGVSVAGAGHKTSRET